MFNYLGGVFPASRSRKHPGQYFPPLPPPANPTGPRGPRGPNQTPRTVRYYDPFSETAWAGQPAEPPFIQYLRDPASVERSVSEEEVDQIAPFRAALDMLRQLYAIILIRQHQNGREFDNFFRDIQWTAPLAGMAFGNVLNGAVPVIERGMPVGSSRLHQFLNSLLYLVQNAVKQGTQGAPAVPPQWALDFMTHAQVPAVVPILPSDYEHFMKRAIKLPPRHFIDDETNPLFGDPHFPGIPSQLDTDPQHHGDDKYYRLFDPTTHQIRAHTAHIPFTWNW